MKNTIEKALQKQKEAKAASQKTSSTEKIEDASHSNAPEESKVSIDKPAPAELPVETVIAEEKEFINKKTPLDEFVIDFVRLDKNGHISLNGERKQINEEYREIKRKLLANAFGSLAKTLHNPNIIMVTSSRPSEGKTFTATNLAMSIASEQDKTVLLVDADVLKPNVLNTLGLERRKGLMEYLTGDVDDISDVLYPTNIDKLKIITAGKSHVVGIYNSF